MYIGLFFFFFKQKTAYEMRISDLSSDVCSSDLLHHHATGRRCAVDIFGQRAEPGAGFFNAVEDKQQVFQRPRQPVELPDGENIAGLETVEQSVEFRPIPAAARGVVLVDPGAACGFECRSEEHTSEPQSLIRITYAVVCLKKKK